MSHDDERRRLTVRITDTEGTALFESEYTVPADERVAEENVVSTGPIRVTASVRDDPTGAEDRTFDFGGCRQARVVITLEDGVVSRIGKQDACRPGEETYT